MLLHSSILFFVFFFFQLNIPSFFSPAPVFFGQCFLNFNVHTNDLGILLKCASDSVVLEWELRFCISTSSRAMPMFLLETHFFRKSLVVAPLAWQQLKGYLSFVINKRKHLWFCLKLMICREPVWWLNSIVMSVQRSFDL